MICEKSLNIPQPTNCHGRIQFFGFITRLDASHKTPRPIQILGVASGMGAPDTCCADGPAAIRATDLLDTLLKNGANIRWRDTLLPTPSDTPLADITDVCSRLAAQVRALVSEHGLAVVLGGDHSCAIGTWSGVSSAVRTWGGGTPGLVWIDAHMDSHTPETSLSGRIHGMPLAVLLGHGAPELVDLEGFSPKLLPENVALVGVRSYERAEADLLERIGVKVFFMDEVHRRGMRAVMHEALLIANRNTQGYGISIDLDAFSPRESPGVGSPIPDGLHHLELDLLLKGIARDPRLLAIELAEFNPHRDVHGKTLALIRQMLLSMLS
ncbi:MAG: arginase [Sulfuricellaceae bacterium]|nr:arginase [Sulfuricellaceae bacterium]